MPGHNDQAAKDRGAKRLKMQGQLAELRSAAIAKLENRGYQVRGKSPSQIRQILRQRPAKRNMLQYRFYNVGSDGHFVGVPLSTSLPNDAAALAEAKKLLSATTVEIWAGTRKVACLPVASQ